MSTQLGTDAFEIEFILGGGRVHSLLTSDWSVTFPDCEGNNLLCC